MEDGELKKMRCMHCSRLVSKRADRMTAHRKTCCVVKPVAPKRSRQEEQGTSDEDDVVVLDDAPTAQHPRAEASTSKEQPKLTPWVVKTDASTREKLDRAVAEFFYGCNVPFIVADHPLFTEMVNQLRPGYRAPDRKKIAGPLLDSVFTDMKNTAKAKLQNVDSDLDPKRMHQHSQRACGGTHHL